MPPTKQFRVMLKPHTVKNCVSPVPDKCKPGLIISPRPHISRAPIEYGRRESFSTLQLLSWQFQGCRHKARALDVLSFTFCHLL